MQATDLARARVTRARFRPRHPPTTGPLTVGDCVSALKSLADKGAAIIDYMRKAGKFDDATVNEITYRVGDAVRKAGAFLEEIAPGQGARADITSATGRRLYEDILNEAKRDTSRFVLRHFRASQTC